MGLRHPKFAVVNLSSGAQVVQTPHHHGLCSPSPYYLGFWFFFPLLIIIHIIHLWTDTAVAMAASAHETKNVNVPDPAIHLKKNTATINLGIHPTSTAKK
jgi:hypothetical protein